MNLHDINVAVARSIGWKSTGFISELGVHFPGVNEHGQEQILPNYTVSLDAIVPVVRSYILRLPEAAYASFIYQLGVATGGRREMATPLQWCNVYLKHYEAWK